MSIYLLGFGIVQVFFTLLYQLKNLPHTHLYLYTSTDFPYFQVFNGFFCFVLQKGQNTFNIYFSPFTIFKHPFTYS